MMTWKTLCFIFLLSTSAFEDADGRDHDGEDSNSSSSSSGGPSAFGVLQDRGFQAYVQCQSTGEGCGNANRCCTSCCRAVKGNSRQCCLSQGLVCDAKMMSPGLSTCCQGLTCSPFKGYPKLTVCTLSKPPPGK